MNLKQYFDSHSTRQVSTVAEQAGTNLAYLRCCRYGQRRISADLAVWLEHASGGLITARELRPDLPWPESRPLAAEDVAPY